jgi:methyltransferase
MNWAALIVGIVAAERLIELIISNRNVVKLRKRGGYEAGRNHYPLIVLLHISWMITVYAAAPHDAPPNALLIFVYVLLQGARVWTITSLGSYWTTRIINVPKAPLVHRGPYRFMRHPNYAIVIAEIAILPLAFGEINTAVIFSALNLLMLSWRIFVENRALDSRT